MKLVRKYTEEFKQEAVNLALKSPSITHTANELGIPVLCPRKFEMAPF